MSDIPESSSGRKRANPGANGERCSEDKDQPNNEVSRFGNLSEQEKRDSEESLALYCQPIEFYNMLQIRAKDRPFFLNRCLDFMIKAKREKRLELTVSLLWNDDKTRPLFPLCICLTRVDPNDKPVKGELKYEAIRICTFRGPSKLDENGNTQVQAKLFIPKLAEEAKSCRYYALILASVENPISLSEVNSTLMPWDVASNESRGGETCLYQEVSFIDFYRSWDTDPNFLLKKKIEIQYDDHLLPCIMKYCFQGKSKCMSIEDCSDSQDERDLKQLEISFSTKKSKAMEKSYNCTRRSRKVGSTSSSLSHIPGLNEQYVSFYYRYYNNKMQKMEALIAVTEDFCCPFCLLKFPSFKGLKCHLTSSHDVFNFEFSPSEDHPSVYVSMEISDGSLESVGRGFDPRVQAFFFCAKRLKRRELKNVYLGRENDTDQLLMDAETLAGDIDPLEKADGSNAIILHPDQDCAPPISDHDHGTLEVPQIGQEGVSNAIILYPGTDGVSPVSDHDHGTPAVPPVEEEAVSNAIILYADPDSVAPISEHGHRTPKVPQAKKRRRPTKRRDSSKNASTSTGDSLAKLKKREFYHSHTYQAMAFEEVLRDQDSEDEINEYAEEVEELRKLAMLDVSDDEKKFLFMWNSFIQKQRVLADAHMTWACEAFTKHHCAELAQSPKLAWCWRLFMIKLWDHNLLDGQTFNNCSSILEEYQKHSSDISQRLKQIQF